MPLGFCVHWGKAMGETCRSCLARFEITIASKPAAPATRSTASAACCAPAPTCSPIGNANG
jgi:hypothetical protein